MFLRVETVSKIPNCCKFHTTRQLGRGKKLSATQADGYEQEPEQSRGGKSSGRRREFRHQVQTPQKEGFLVSGSDGVALRSQKWAAPGVVFLGGYLGCVREKGCC